MKLSKIIFGETSVIIEFCINNKLNGKIEIAKDEYVEHASELENFLTRKIVSMLVK